MHTSRGAVGKRSQRRRWRRDLFIAAFVSFLTLVISSRPGGTAAAAPAGPTIPEIAAGTQIPVTTAWGVASAVFAPIWIAHDRGYFGQYGLKVTLQQIEGVVQAQAVIAGKVQFGDVGGAELLNARATGAPMVGIFQTTDAPTFELHAPPSIRTIGELKGKTIAITRTGSLTDMVARVLLRKHGLVPDQDVKLLSMTGMGGIVAALKAGVVQGGVLSFPAATKAAAAGFPSIASTVAEHVHLQQAILVVMKPYAEAHPAEVFAYLKAFLQGLRDYLAEPEVAYAAIAKYTHSDPATARAAYAATRTAMLSTHYMNEEGLKTVQEFGVNPGASQVKLADAHDDHFLRALEASGFLKRLNLPQK